MIKKRQISFIVLFLFLIQLFVVHPKKIFASDFNSDFVFRSNFGGIQNESFTSVINTQDGNFIAVGYSSSVDGDLEGISKVGYNDAIIVKYDNQGNIIWKKTFGGNDNDSFQGVAELSDGNIIAVGYSFSTTSDLEGLRRGWNWGADSIIVKYDKDGNIIWKKIFGGSYHEQFNSVKATRDGGFITVGSSNSNDYDLSDLNKGYQDAVIVKYNENGEIEWVKTFGGNGDDSFNNVIQTIDESFVAVGFSSSMNGDLEYLKNDGSYDSIIIKFDKHGNIIWKNTFGGQSSDSFEGITESSNGEYIVVGSSYSNNRDMLELNNGDSDGTIVKYDINGNIIWKKTFGGSYSDYLKSVTCDLNNEIIVAGFSSSYDGDLAGLYRGNYEAIIFKMDNNGNIISKNSFGGTKNDNFYSVIVSTTGNYVVVGYSESNDMHMTNKNKGYQDAIIIGMKDSFLKTVYVEGIKLERNSKILKIGDSFKLKYTITPIEATNKTIIWESSNPAIATIDSLGYVKALREGNATITIRTLDGNYTDSCEIVVGSLKTIYNKTFGGNYYEKFNSVFYSDNGEIVAVGHNNSSGTLGYAKGGQDAVIIILDKNKNVIFTHNFGGYSSDEFFDAIKTTTGDYVAVGYSWSNDLDMYGLNKGFMDAIIVKYDSNGNIVWKKSFGGSDSDYFYSIVEAYDGGYIAVGESQSSNFDMDGIHKGNGDAIIVKYNKDGKVMWKKAFGGSSNDILYSVIRDANGNFVAAGYTSSYDKDLANIKSHWSEDALIIKFDENGEIIWTKIFGGYGGDYFKSIINTNDENIIAVGYSYSNDLDMEGLNKGSEDAIIVKFDNQGNVIWKNSFGGSYRDIFNSVVESSDGGFIAVGNSWSIDKDIKDLYYSARLDWSPPSNDAIMVKFDANGNLV